MHFALLNKLIDYCEYNIKLMILKNNLMNLLILNYGIFKITMIYIS